MSKEMIQHECLVEKRAVLCNRTISRMNNLERWFFKLLSRLAHLYFINLQFFQARPCFLRNFPPFLVEEGALSIERRMRTEGGDLGVTPRWGDQGWDCPPRPPADAGGYRNRVPSGRGSVFWNDKVS
jgi:hypothetical protein